MPFDPTLPVNNSLISSSELRNQLNGLNELIEFAVPFLRALEIDPAIPRGFLMMFAKAGDA